MGGVAHKPPQSSACTDFAPTPRHPLSDHCPEEIGVRIPELSVLWSEERAFWMRPDPLDAGYRARFVCGPVTFSAFRQSIEWKAFTGAGGKSDFLPNGPHMDPVGAIEFEWIC